MFGIYPVIAQLFGFSVMIAGDLYSDSRIRKTEYTDPLATMPANADMLLKQMLSTYFEEHTDETGHVPSWREYDAKRSEILGLLAGGAFTERNRLMKTTRARISGVGRLISWFCKQKGLTYQQVEDKYKNDFTNTERDVFEKIIQSASRANPNVAEKFFKRIFSVFGIH